MITYEMHPISALDMALLHKWLTHREAQLFKDCVVAEMHRLYFDSINAQTHKDIKTEEDQKKFNNQSLVFTRQADDIHQFLKMFERFASPEYKYQRLKIN